MIKIDSGRYIDVLCTVPDLDMILSGWEYEVKMFLYLFPYVEYTKDY